MDKLEKLKEHLLGSKLKELITQADIKHDELTIVVGADAIPKVLKALKADKKYTFDQLISICGADYPSRPERFEVVYHLLNMRQNYRLRVKIMADEETFVPSVTDIYPCANWYEREVWDMLGIRFSGHPDLRRILMDERWQGHPLRKDYPLRGYQLFPTPQEVHPELLEGE